MSVALPEAQKEVFTAVLGLLAGADAEIENDELGSGAYLDAAQALFATWRLAPQGDRDHVLLRLIAMTTAPQAPVALTVEQLLDAWSNAVVQAAADPAGGTEVVRYGRSVEDIHRGLEAILEDDLTYHHALLHRRYGEIEILREALQDIVGRARDAMAPIEPR